MKDKIDVIYSVFDNENVLKALEQASKDLVSNNDENFFDNLFEVPNVKEAITEAMQNNQK